ncbi:MAG: hypothetical protein ACIAS6_12050 [Phycisphaerales bacterium JB060]
MGRKHAVPILMVAAGALVLFVSIEPRRGQATLTPEAPKPPEPSVHVGTLQGRDYGVRIEVTEEGPRYTVVDRQGVVVADRLTLETLAERYPRLAPYELWADEQGNSLGPLMIVPDTSPN